MKKILSFIIIAIIMTSCSSDNESSSTFKPSLTNLELATKVPSNLQQNSPQTYLQIRQMEAYMNMGSMYMNNTTGRSATTNRTSADTNTWNYGGYTVTYSYNLVGNKYQFTYTITLNSVIYYSITGWQNTDGTAGHWNYSINTSVLGASSSANFNITFDWTRSTIGDYHFVMDFDMGATNNLHYVTNINHDLSGNTIYSSNSVQYYGSTWNSTGHGQFTNYLTNPPTVTNF